MSGSIRNRAVTVRRGDRRSGSTMPRSRVVIGLFQTVGMVVARSGSGRVVIQASDGQLRELRC
jgi:hypothetical protein